MMEYHLENFVQIFVSKCQKYIYNDRVQEMIETYSPQKEITFVLSLSYQKIMILLTEDTINYHSIIDSILKKMFKSPLERSTKEVKLFYLVSIVNFIQNIDIDELIIQNFMQKSKK